MSRPVLGLFRGYRAQGVAVNHLPRSAEVKGRVLIPLCAVLVCSRAHFTFTFTRKTTSTGRITSSIPSCYSWLSSTKDPRMFDTNANQKVKVKFTLEQTTKAQRGSRCIALLFLQPQRSLGVGGQRHAPAALPP